MNKRKSAMALCVASFASLGAIVIGASYKAAGSLFFAKADAAGVWMHYAKKAASKGSDGIREYWVSCQTNEHVFVAPSDATIQEATSYDTSGFTADDDRWIKAVTLSAQEVLMTDGTKTLDLGEYADGSVSSIKAGTFNLGTDASNLDVSGFAADHSDDGVKAVEVETTKDGKEYVLYFDTTFVTANIASVTDFKTYILPESGVNKLGYFKLTNNISMTNQVSYVSSSSSKDYFGGIFDGNSKTITFASNGGCGLFSNLRNATVKNLTIHDNWYNGSNNCVLLGRYVFSTTLNNVTTKITAGSPGMTTAGTDSPKCYAPDGTGACGYLANNTFQANTLKDCTFDATGYKLGSLFGWNQSMTPPTVTNCVVKATSLVQAMHSNYTTKTYQPENVTLAEGEEAIKGLTFVEAK